MERRGERYDGLARVVDISIFALIVFEDMRFKPTKAAGGMKRCS